MKKREEEQKNKFQSPANKESMMSESSEKNYDSDFESGSKSMNEAQLKAMQKPSYGQGTIKPGGLIGQAKQGGLIGQAK